MNRLQRLLPFVTLIALAVALTIATPHFLTAINLASVVRQTAVINLMALGMTLVIITGGIDLSVGSTLALSGLFGTMAIKAGLPIPVSIFIGIGTGLLCGLLNGLMITQLRINPFIVTLGTLEVFRGLALVKSKGLPVHEIPDAFSFLGDGNLLGIPFSLWVLAVCALLMHFVLEHTKLGRYAFAIGSNQSAAYYAGVPIKFHLVSVYAIAGLLAGLAGMVEASRLMTGQPTAGQGYELQAIAAVVIGGGSLQGGEGSVVGTLIGAFIIGLLSNGSDLLGINPYWQQVTIGAVIIAAVGFDELRKRKFDDSAPKSIPQRTASEILATFVPQPAATVAVAAPTPSPASPIIQELQATDDPKKKCELIRSLAKYRGDEVLEVLVRALKDPDEEVRVYAVGTLRDVGDARAVEPLIQVLMTDTAHQPCYYAAKALARFKTPRAIAGMVSALESQKGDLSELAFQLGEMRAREAVDALCKLAESSADVTAYARRHAVMSLGNIGDRRAIPSLQKALNDKDDGVRKRAQAALTGFGEGTSSESNPETV